MRSISIALTIFCLLGISAVARADKFVVEDGGAFDFDTVIFTIPAGLAPSSYVLGSSVTYDLMVVFDDVPQMDEVTFFQSNGHAPNFHDALSGSPVIGQTLYTGPESSPTFLTGYFALPVDGDGDVTITPEPSGFALLGTGVLGLFGLARRRLCV